MLAAMPQILITPVSPVNELLIVADLGSESQAHTIASAWAQWAMTTDALHVVGEGMEVMQWTE